MASVYPLSHGETGVSTLSFFAVNGAPPSATVTRTDLAIRPMNGPPLGDQPGMPQSLETNDARISTGVYQAGITWWGANDGCTVAGSSQLRSCIRLFEIRTGSGTTSIVQDFDFNGGTGEDDYFPGITLDAAGDLAVTYAFSSASAYPSMAVSLRLASQLTAGLQSPTVVAAGKDDEKGGRYGDFCDASPSYANGHQVWLACEYILSYSNYVWNTHVQKLIVTA
jgi:hypothetical protein